MKFLSGVRNVGPAASASCKVWKDCDESALLINEIIRVWAPILIHVWHGKKKNLLQPHVVMRCNQSILPERNEIKPVFMDCVDLTVMLFEWQRCMTWSFIWADSQPAHYDANGLWRKINSTEWDNSERSLSRNSGMLDWLPRSFHALMTYAMTHAVL